MKSTQIKTFFTQIILKGKITFTMYSFKGFKPLIACLSNTSLMGGFDIQRAPNKQECGAFMHRPDPSGHRIKAMHSVDHR